MKLMPELESLRCIYPKKCLCALLYSVMMGDLSRRGDAPDKPGSWHEGNVDAGYPRRINDFFFIAFHFAA